MKQAIASASIGFVIFVGVVCTGAFLFKLIWWICAWAFHFADQILPMPLP